jgi:hypothetical protein
MTEFVGRAGELAELRRLLDARQANLVIVEGAPADRQEPLGRIDGRYRTPLWMKSNWILPRGAATMPPVNHLVPKLALCV